MLNIASVHPVRESEALEFLKQENTEGKKLEELVAQKRLVRIIHQGCRSAQQMAYLEKWKEGT